VRQVASLARDAQLFREGRGWTRKQLAEIAGLHEQPYGDFEACRTWPAASTLHRVGAARRPARSGVGGDALGGPGPGTPSGTRVRSDRAG
jgi:transcriptional regulator with XRE-family HTH domain